MKAYTHDYILGLLDEELEAIQKTPPEGGRLSADIKARRIKEIQEVKQDYLDAIHDATNSGAIEMTDFEEN